MRQVVIRCSCRCSRPPAAAAQTPVADAVMNRDAAGLRALLQKKADVNATQVDGSTALHWAVYHDNLQAADLLIAAGANVKAVTREGVTPLAMATHSAACRWSSGCSRRAPMRRSAGRTAKRC